MTDFECTICFDSDLDTDQQVKLDCDHVFCGDCIFKYLKEEISDRNNKIQCPQKYCEEIISDSMIIKIIYEDDDTVNAFKKNKNLLNISDDHAMCIYCKSVVPCSSNNKFYCYDCYTTYCSVCKEIHSDSDDYDKCPNENEIVTNLHDARENLESEDVKFCPICKIMIYKEGGCNSVKCDYCKLRFCWNCLRTNLQIEQMDSDSEHTCGNYGTFLQDDDDDYVNGY